MEDGVNVIHSNLFTSGIGYLKVLFDTSRVPVEDLPYVGFLRQCWDMWIRSTTATGI